MTKLAAFLLSGLLGTALPATGTWEGESHFTLGVEYNSNLYEFEEHKLSATWTALKAMGEYGTQRQILAYSFSILDPWGASGRLGWPSRMVHGHLGYRLSLDMGTDLRGVISARYQLRDTKSRRDRYPVEEDPYTLMETEFSMIWKERAKVSLALSLLDPEYYTIFAYRRLQTGLRVDPWRGRRSRLYIGAGVARYVYDHKVLFFPDRSFAPPPPPPSFREHRDTSWTVTAGWEYAGPALWQAMIFYQDSSSTIHDFSYTGWGFDAAASLSPAPGWNLLAAVRWEDRRLAKSYLLFDPRVLTEAGTNFVSLRIRRGLRPGLDLELSIGRYVHDIRQDFFDTDRPRNKISLSLAAAL